MSGRIKLAFDPVFTGCISAYNTLVIESDVVNSTSSDMQIAEMARLADTIAERYTLSDINKIPAIAATRNAYKLCGKDPNRYRPSQEQLMRRIVRGLGLYNVNAIVDAGNQLSLMTGCSVGCFDADKVVGDTITLGVGRENEPYEGIGRGMINIAGLPVFRDGIGGIGTPTSDNERTKITLDTRKLLVTIHLFDTSVPVDNVLASFTDIFARYASATDIKSECYSL